VGKRQLWRGRNFSFHPTDPGHGVIALGCLRQADTWFSFGLAFVGGYGDAASFVLAKTFTGHVTGNLVLAAIAVAAREWRAVLEHFSAVVRDRKIRI
jgi:hypothetical protein